MNSLLKEYIEGFEVIDQKKYHSLISVFGKEQVDKEINCYVKEQLDEDFSYESQIKLWERFGYYFATLDDSIFIEKAVQHLSINNDIQSSRDDFDGLSLEDERKYGYHLLSQNYITICLDEHKNKVDMMKVFASIHSVEIRDVILKRFEDLYGNINRTSNYDKEMQEFIKKYKNMCVECELPKLRYQGELLKEDVLLEQIDMYIRYSMAKDKFIKHNQLLIYKVSYQTKYDIDDNDIFNEGYFGLLRAVELYDVRKGYVFSTYAMQAIKRTIGRYLNNLDKLIRLPFRAEALEYKIDQFNESFFSRFGYYPTVKEIALELGLSTEVVYEIQKSLIECNCLSFDCKVLTNKEDEKNSVLGDFVADKQVNVEDDVINNEHLKYVFDAIDTKLTEKQQIVILERLKDRTLKSIGEDMGVTREYIRQIEKSAIKKLQRVPGIKG